MDPIFAVDKKKGQHVLLLLLKLLILWVGAGDKGKNFLEGAEI